MSDSPPSPAASGEEPDALVRTRLPPRTTLRIITDGRAGHETQTLGLAEALGVAPEIRAVAPRGPYEWLAPFGPPDPRDAPAIAPPYPDIVLAAGRRTIPALRRLKRNSAGQSFTIYLNAPGRSLDSADLIVAPRHDNLFGPNVISPLTPPNRVTPQRLAAARAAPDPRLAALPGPRVAMLVGSAEGIAQDLDHIAASLMDGGFSVMVTPSRRTLPKVADALRKTLTGPRGFFWDGEGANPYFSMLSNADRILVTGDSVNMIGEAAATGVPVHVIEPHAPRRKITAYLDALEEAGVVRRWRGPFEDWTYTPVNSTPMVARRIIDAYAAFRDWGGRRRLRRED